MNKFLSIICLALFISASLAKKSTTDKAVDAAADLKDKVVETVCYILSFFFSLTFYRTFI
jgi:cytochrome c5